MSAEIISGKEIAASIRKDLSKRVMGLRESGITPGLAVVLVGDNPASKAYVGMKDKAATEIGIYSRQITLSNNINEDELLGVISGLNSDPDIHGILVQLPLPVQIDEPKILMAIDPDKDVDGFHPINVGLLATGDTDVLAPCTPQGVIEMLMRNGHDPAGKHVVIVGRSNIVGRPLASLLLRKTLGGNATVTVAHSHTSDLSDITQKADILVVAIGIPEFIKRDMVKPGAVVIDVGINRVEDAKNERGYRLTGDVHFDEVKEVASAISPVPGGMGPMTIAMLLSNTVDAAIRSASARN
jgi:methylenetetrahydrofolate dehydrogenase (NADP+)/methenyltetrahydrofolate cyclohydrolase